MIAIFDYIYVEFHVLIGDCYFSLIYKWALHVYVNKVIVELGTAEFVLIFAELNHIMYNVYIVIYAVVEESRSKKDL